MSARDPGPILEAIGAGRYAEGLELFVAAAQAHEAAGDTQLALGCFENGILAARSALGEAPDGEWRRWHEADKIYHDARLPAPGDGLTAVFGPGGRGGDPRALRQRVVELLIATASLYLRMGQDAAAAVRFEMALSRSAAGPWPALAARARIGASAVARRAGALDAARVHVDAALAGLAGVAGDVATDRGEALAARAEIHRVAGDLEAAAADLREAAATTPGVEALDARQSLAEVLVELGRPDDAADLFEAITADARCDRARRLRAEWQRGRLSMAAGDARAAHRHLSRAVAAAEAATGALLTDEGRLGLAGAFDGLRDDAFEAALAVGATEQALEIVERGRAATFEAMIAGGRVTRDSGGGLTGVEQIASATAISAVGERAAIPDPALPRLVYAIAEADTVRFVVEPGAPPRADRLGAGRAVITAAVDALYTAGAHDGGFTRHLRPARLARHRAPLERLAELLLGDLTPPGGDDVPLVIEPDGPLWQVPFAALPDGSGRPLGLRRPLVHAPSAATLTLTRRVPARRPPPLDLAAVLSLLGKAPPGEPPKEPPKEPPPAPVDPGPRALVVGNPRMPRRLNLSSLPGAEDEAARVAAHLPGATVLTGADATIRAVEARMDEVDILHLATHGSDAPDPRDAWIALADDGPRGGGWRMADVMRARSCPPRVVLSACETGRGTITSDGVVGLARAFLVAGARSVIVSLTRVDDRVTADFMDRLYEAASVMPLAVALREAMRGQYAALEAEGRPWPSLWAPFILVGAET